MSAPLYLDPEKARRLAFNQLISDSGGVVMTHPQLDPEMIIKVALGQQYGQEVIRPACPKAELFCEIAGSKTLTRRLVEQIKRLGYKVEVMQTLPKEL